MKNLQTFDEFLTEAFSIKDTVDYSNSKNIIIVGRKTNLLDDMRERYIHTVNGNETYFFSKGKHFATLFDDPRFPEIIKHDGSLTDKGWIKK